LTPAFGVLALDPQPIEGFFGRLLRLGVLAFLVQPIGLGSLVARLLGRPIEPIARRRVDLADELGTLKRVSNPHGCQNQDPDHRHHCQAMHEAPPTGGFRNGGEYSKIVSLQPARCTNTAPSCTRARKHATRTAGLFTLAPDVTSHRQACHGHETTVPSRSPSPSGPPRWPHVLSIA